MSSWQQRLPLMAACAGGIFFLSVFGATIFTKTTSQKLGPAAFGATVYTTRTIDKIGSSADGDTNQITVTMYAEGRYDTIWEYDTLYDTAFTYDTLYDTAFTYDTLYDTAFTYDTLYDTAFTYDTLYDTAFTYDTLYDTAWAYDTLYDTAWVYDTLYDTTRKPIDVVLGVDLSTSMLGVDSAVDPQRRPRIVWTKLAALHFLDSLKPGDRVAVMGWTSSRNGLNIADTSNATRYFHKWCNFTTDFNVVRSFIRDSIFIDNTTRRVDTVEGQILVVQDNIPNATFMYTPLRISTVVTAKNLSITGRTDATRAVIMLTDGSNNDNLAQSVPVALLDSLYRTKGQRYYAIGFVAGDTAELRTLTSAGGGTYYHASNISELDSAYGALAEMLISETFDTTVTTTPTYDTTFSTTPTYDTTVSTTPKYDTTVSTTPKYDTTVSTTPTYDTNISTTKVQVVQDTTVRGLDAVLLFDKSGSMSGTRIAAAKQAGHDFVGMLGDSDRVAILGFSYSTDYDTIANFTPYSGFSAALAAMDAMIASGSTALWYSSLKTMEYTLMNMRPKAVPVLIILTDGADNASGSVTFDSLMRFITPLGFKVPVFTISLGTATNESQLQAIATSTGGSYYRTANPDSLSEIYQDIARIVINNVGARNVRIVENVPSAYTYIAGSQAAGPANMTVFDSMYSVTGAGGTTLTWTAPVLSVWDTLQAQYRIFVPVANAGDTLGNTIVSDITYEDNESQDHEIVFGHAPPAAPSLVSPAFYAANVPVTPTLLWNKSCIAQTYGVMVSLNSSFTSSVVNVSSISDTSYTLGVILANSTRYYWRVNSTNAFGTSAWSSVWNFSTVVAAPGIPVLSSPANGAVNVALNTTLSWVNGTGGAPSSYHVQVATDPTFASPFSDTTVIAPTRTRVLTGLSASTTYYWRVSAINPGGTSAWSALRSFTTVPPLPDVPVLALPADASVDQLVTGLALSWNAAARTVTYRVQVSTMSNFAVLYYNTTVAAPAVSLMLGAMANQTTYYWRVNATNPGGTSAWSAVWSFTTVPLPSDVPVLVSPADVSIDQPINGLVLSWNAAARAVTYRVQVSTVSDFVSTYSDTTVAAPAVSLTVSGMEYLTIYYWRVNATNSGGTSAWSSVYRYATVVAAPGIAVLSSPVDGATNVALNPTLSWTAPGSGGEPSLYQVQISTESTFASTVLDTVVIAPATMLTAAGLSTSTTYYWRVNTINRGGSAWSAVQTFGTVKCLLVPIAAGWNMISLNIHPVDSATDTILGPLSRREFILAKNELGEVYCPLLSIDDIGALHTGKGYQVYSGAVDTIRADGSAVKVASSPLSLPAGWSMIGYLPQSDMPIVTALAGITPQILIVKNNEGQAYFPDYFIDDIGTMRVGAGYQVFMKAAAVLTYPGFATLAKAAAGAHAMIALPVPRHYVFKLNTGNNLSMVASRITLQGRIVPDSSEIGVFDSRGKLVGAGSVLNGLSALAVWGDDPQTKEKEGCGPAEMITFKLWNGKKEYPLDLQSGSEPRYSTDGIIIGTLSVPEEFFITSFALSKAYPNPFRGGGSIKIAFDVPMIAGTAEHAVEITIYDIKGGLVQRLAKGSYKAGHYCVAWNSAAGNDRKFSSNVYIVQMRARNFDQKIKVFRIR